MRTNRSSEKKQPSELDALELRLICCPACKRNHLVTVDELPTHLTCACQGSFLAAEHLVTTDDAAIEECYSKWECPKCQRSLLVPRFAVDLPGQCPCGHDHPTRAKADRSFGTFDTVADAFIGNDPLLSENMLVPLRAAQRYDYEVSREGEQSYRVRNPTKGTSYIVDLSPDFRDECQCDVFCTGAATCIHIEHVRLKLGMPSTAQALAEATTFAYAWFDKSSLPPRIRVGWMGHIEQDVRKVMQEYQGITTYFPQVGI